jgi:hypothetical protein
MRLGVDSSLTLGMLLYLPMLAAGCTTPSTTDNTLTGRERLSWQQSVASVDELARYRFAVYVDSKRVDLPETTCTEPVKGTSTCSSPLPPLEPGVHRLEVVSYSVPDGVESPKALSVEVTIKP